MSSNGNTQERQTAERAFAGEINDMAFTFKEGDDDKDPLFGLLPTGQKANRLLIVTTLMEPEDVGTDQSYWRGKLIDPTGSAYVYAGQYQPQAEAFLREVETPAYVAVVGKPRTFETDEGEIRVSIRPESITEVTGEAREKWVAETAEKTLDRIEAFNAEEGYGGLAAKEYDKYGDDYLSMVVEALEKLDEELGETNGEKEGKTQTTDGGQTAEVGVAND